MRTETEMVELILKTARECEKVRIVELNGSRANPAAKKDAFQDYDIIFYVENVDFFTQDHSWVDVFGERLIMQMPDQMDISPAEDARRSFAYLMLFTDGNRIDLTLTPVELVEESLEKMDFRTILLDKDERLSAMPLTAANPFTIQEPMAKDFADCANEFWWVSIYIAKALWRQELPLAKSMMDGPVRDMLMRLLDWHVGFTTDFAVSTGKSGKDLQTYLDAATWDKLVQTYPDGDYQHIWTSLLVMCDLFDEASNNIAEKLNVPMPDYSQKVLPYLKGVQQSSLFKTKRS